jgi:hypothetical protein
MVADAVDSAEALEQICGVAAALKEAAWITKANPTCESC